MCSSISVYVDDPKDLVIVAKVILHSVIKRTSGGKIMVFPMLHDLGLTPVSELAEKFPEVAAKLNDGLWTKEAEEALLASAK